MAVSSDGNAYSWGAGYKGKLGHQAKWTHENPANEPTPRKIENVEGRILKCSAGGIHSNMLTEDGRVLSFGCGSDGRLGHAESSEFRYLYREGYPRPIDALKDYFIKNL